MTRVDSFFIASVRLALRGQYLPLDTELSEEDWVKLFRLSDKHSVLPLVYEAVYRCASFKALDKETRGKFQEISLQAAVRQITQSNEFLTILVHGKAQKLDPVVLKGITVRSLYPLPMLRPSVDEDVLVSPDEAEIYHRFFLAEGLIADNPDAEPSKANELSYHKPASPTYIELHMGVFPRDSSAYGDLNELFAGAMERTEHMQIEDVSVRVLAPTDHLLYLLCHAYKHFLHGGFGIRQICDIAVFAERYDAQIDWASIRQRCESVRIGRFTAAVFRVASRHLGFAMPELFSDVNVDESDLLEDVLSGGLYGVDDINRAHSSTITLDAVAKQKQGKRRAGALASVFLPLRSMRGKFPYLKKHPWLLPVAWGQRVWNYLRHSETKVDPGASVRIGSERVRLLKEYGIID